MSNRRTAVLEALREHGPMTVRAIADVLEWPTRDVSETLSSARRHCPGKLVRIIRYEPQVGVWGGDLPVYSASSGPDMARPAVDRKARRKAKNARYWAKNQTVLNARKRLQRGHPEEAANPWMRLVPKESRSFVGQRAAALLRTP